MPVEDTTPNNGFHYPTGGNDGTDFAAGLQDLADDVDEMWIRGTISNLPAAGLPGRRYYATDILQELCDTGSSWIPVGSATPTGAMMQYAGSSDPIDSDGTTRWMICDGRAVSRTTYAALFGEVSTTYGTGDGSTTFNIPDLRQRFPLGKAPSGTGSTLGATGGAIDHTHSVPGLTVPGHYHTSGADEIWMSTSGYVTTTIIQASSGVSQGGVVILEGTPNANNTVGNVANNGDAGFSTGTGTTGGDNPPYLVVNHIIKVR